MGDRERQWVRREPSATTEHEWAADGWAAASLDRSLQRALTWGVTLCQAPIALAVLVSTAPALARLVLVVAHLAVAGLGALTARERVPSWALAVAVPNVVLVDWWVTPTLTEPLCFAALWLCHTAQLMTILGLRGWASVGVAAYLNGAVPVTVALAHPEWVEDLLIPTASTGLGMQVGARLLLPVLHRLVRRFDTEVREGWEARQALAAARAASTQAAEHARTLHDSAINTLAAVASGGAAVQDPDLVRERCRRDLAVLDHLEQGTPVVVDIPLDAMAAELGLRAVHEGLEADELAQIVASLSPRAARALRGALAESLLNVAKHAGTQRVRVRAAVEDDHLVVEVEDHGSGFDVAPLPGRGIAESIIGRATDAGIAVELDSEPGRGTVVTLRCPLAETPELDDLGDDRATEALERFVRQVRSHGSWLWTVGTVVIGVAIEVLSRPGTVSATYGALAVVGTVGALAWWDVQRRGRLSDPVSLLVVAAVAAAHVLAMAAIDFGRGDPIPWQAIAVVPLLVILHAHGSSRWLPLGLAALAAATAAAMLAPGPALRPTLTLLVGTAPALFVLGAWIVFHRQVEVLGRRAVETHRAAQAARFESAAREAALAARERWRHAGLARCRSLLEGLVHGADDPGDPAVQAACADEEAFLRQVMLLDPELFRLGPWLASSLSLARAREVHLTVRAGGHDVDDDATARALGGLLADVVASAPSGSEVTTTLFASRGHLIFTVVGPLPAIVLSAARWEAPHAWTAGVHGHDRVGMIEVTGPTSAQLLEVAVS